MPGIVKISCGQVYSRTLGYIFPNGQEVRVGRDLNDRHSFNVVITEKDGNWPIAPIIGEGGGTLVFSNIEDAHKFAKETFDYFMKNPSELEH